MSDDVSRNALWVKLDDVSEDKIAVGIYKVHQRGHPEVEGSEDTGQPVAEFLGGVLLEPTQAYEVAQRLTMTAIKVEENRKARGV